MAMCSTGCGKEAPKDRKLCWSCTAYKKRGMTWQEAAQKKEERYKNWNRGKCQLCGQMRRLLQLHVNYPYWHACDECRAAFRHLLDPSWRSIALHIFDSVNPCCSDKTMPDTDHLRIIPAIAK